MNIPTGWKLVPVEPTENMVAWLEVLRSGKNANLCYRAMLAAAPTPPAQQDYEALEVLRGLLDEQDDPPLIRRAQQWQAAVDAARALLTKRGAA